MYNTEPIKDLAIVMVTCDKYSFIWPSWYHWFKKNFPQGIGKLYWTNETIDCPYPEFRQIKVNIPDPGKWTKRVRTAIKQIPENNIVFLLDDLLMVKPIDEFRKLYYYFKFLGMDSMIIIPAISKNLKFTPTTTPHLFRLQKYSWYLISYSITIYRKAYLLECLWPVCSIWDSEIKMTRWLWVKAFFGRNYKVYNYTKDWFVNAIQRGKVNEQCKKYL